MSNIPYVRQEEQQTAFIRSTEIPYAQQLGLQQLVIQGTPPPSTPTYVVWSILNCVFCCGPLWIVAITHSKKILLLHGPAYLCLCCCCPLGIAAICYSNKVSKKTANNDQVGALEASQTARKINIAATVIGSIGIIVTVVILIINFVVFGKAVFYIFDENFPFT